MKKKLYKKSEIKKKIYHKKVKRENSKKKNKSKYAYMFKSMKLISLIFFCLRFTLLIFIQKIC